MLWVEQKIGYWKRIIVLMGLRRMVTKWRSSLSYYFVGARLACPLKITTMLRKIIRLSGFDYATPGYYYVTLCTKNKQCLFGKVAGGEMMINALGRIVVEVWQGLASNFSDLVLDEFIVMPNHVHGLVRIEKRLSFKEAGTAATLSQVVGALKSKSTLLCRKRLFPEKKKLEFWQKTFYDRVIRNEEELLKVREYIRYNAQKWEKDEYFV